MAATAVGTPILQEAVEGRANGVFTSTFKWVIQVEISTNVLNMLPSAAALAHSAYLPYEGNPHPVYSTSSCRSVKCEKTDKNGVYIYTAEYSDENSTDQQKQTDDNPLLDLPVVKPVAGMKSRAITRDRDGRAILNTAADPILQTMDDNTIGFRISSNVASVPQWILTFRNTTNDAPITVGGLTIGTNMARFILPDDWLSEQKNRNGVWYYEFRYELQIDERDSHYGYPLNAGFREYAYDQNFDKYPKTITLPDGSEPADPQPLDADGFRIEDPDPDNVIYVEVKKYPEATYSVLPGVS